MPDRRLELYAFRDIYRTIHTFTTILFPSTQVVPAPQGTSRREGSYVRRAHTLDFRRAF